MNINTQNKFWDELTQIKNEIKTEKKKENPERDKLAKLSNKKIQLITKCFMDNTCPMSFRKLVEAQHSHKRTLKGDTDGQTVRVKTFISSATLGFGFTFFTRALRTVARTGLSPFSFFYALGKQNRYGLKDEVKYHFKRIGDEWKDLGVTLYTLPVGLIKTFSPGFASNQVKAIRNYYIKRIVARQTRDAYVDRKIKDYESEQKRVKRLWNEALKEL